MAVRSMRTTAGWDQRTREKERKKRGYMECSFNQLPSGSARLFFTMFLFVWHASSFFFLSAKFLTFLSIAMLLAYRLLFRFYCGIHLFVFFAIDFFIVKWELPGSSESRRRNNKREGRTIHQTYQDYPERKRKQRREGITHIEVEHTAMLHMPLDRNCIDRRPGQLRARLYVTTRSWAEK